MEQIRFWEAQWLGRLKSSEKATKNRETKGIPFDQPEIPYTALYLLGLLRETVECDINVIDLWNKGSHSVDIDTLRTISSHYDVFLFSPFTNNYSFAKQCVSEIKKINSDSICVVGGHHASFCAEECRMDGFDYVIAGKGEKALIELAKSSWRMDGHVLSGSDGSQDEIDYWNGIIPAYDLLPDRYRKTYYARLFTTHGCPFNCVFCSNTVWHRKKTIFMPISRVEQELSQIKAKISFEEIYINDENFTLESDHFKKVSALMNDSCLKWGCETRIDIVDKDKLRILATNGCNEIDYGLESLDEKVLRLSDKGINLEDAYRIFSETAENGIRSHVNLMVGLPGETKASAIRTVEVICDWIRKGIVSTVDYFVTVPYPGTALFNYHNDFGMEIHTTEWDQYREDSHPVFNLDSMRSDEIYSCWIHGLNEFSKTIESLWR